MRKQGPFSVFSGAFDHITFPRLRINFETGGVLKQHSEKEKKKLYLKICVPKWGSQMKG